MSVELLTQLQGAHAFESVPSRQEMADFHVNFDTLTSTTGCETAALSALRRGERIALVGPTGAGKSSVIASVLGPLVEGLAPLPIPVSTAPEAMSDGSAFVRHVIATVGRWVTLSQPQAATHAGILAKRSEGRHATNRTFALHVAPQWLVEGMQQGVELGAELRSATTAEQRTPDEVFDIAREILGIVRDGGHEPVLVLDDTDRWTNINQGQTRAYRDMFFGTIIRTIAEQLRVPMIVAVHPTYLQDQAYLAAAGGFLDTTITVPRLPTSTGIGMMLARRAALALDLPVDREATLVQDIIEQNALNQLFHHYATHEHSVRAVIRVAHASLTAAADEGADFITEGHVRAELEIG